MARSQGLTTSFTRAELKEFDQLTRGMESVDQMTRIKCRLRWRRFYDLHGQEKCTAMQNELIRKGEWK